MAARLELGAQLVEVVDLAVEHQDDLAVLAEHRLVAPVDRSMMVSRLCPSTAGPL